MITSELQPGAAGGVGQRGDAPGVAVAGPVEHHPVDARRLGPLGQQRADLAGQLRLGTGGTAQRGVQRRGRHQRVTLGVVDHLSGDLPQGPGDDQAGPLGGTAEVLADPEVPAGAADVALRGWSAGLAALEQRGAHFLPAFPALRRMTSPWYRTPLPLYGS